MEDQAVHLAVALAQLSSRSDLYWNDSGRYENCVWVSTAKYFGLQVAELEREVGKNAPPGGASVSQIHDFLEAISNWDRGGQSGRTGLVLLAHGFFT